MQFTCKIAMDNSAFEDGPEEVARILRKIAHQIEAGSESAKCLDGNGNSVGSWKITGR